MKIKAIYLYLLFIAWAILLEVLLKYAHLNVTGLGITLLFLTIVLSPGVFLWRVSGLKAENFVSKWLYVLAFGLCYYFFINLLGILLNLNILQVLWIAFAVGVIVYGLSFWLDRYVVIKLKLELRSFSFEPADWLLAGFIIIGAVFAFFIIDAQTDKLIGDGWFHLAILQKITSGEGLNPYNLLLTKGASLNPVYSFPLWHILVGELAKTVGISIFTALKQVLLPLVILSMVTWYALATLIFKNRYLVWLSFLAFLLVFLKDNSFYYLTALASPDSFNRLLLMPLILGLSVIFIFNRTGSKIFNTSLLSLLVVFMGLIHFTQLIYFVLILIVLLFFRIFPIVSKKKEEFLKILMVLVGLAVLTVPYLLIFQRQALSIFLSGNVQAKPENLTFRTYLGANIIYRYAILSLPIIILFAKKNARLLILPAVALGALLIYWPFLGLQPFFLKYLGDIFVSRAIANIPHFLYFGFLLFLIIWGLSHLLVKNRLINIVSMIFFGFLTIIGLIYPNFYGAFVENYLFSETFGLFMTGFWVLFILAVIISLIIFFKKKEVLFSEPENKLGFAVLAIFLTIILATPYFEGVKKVLAENSNGSILSNRLTTNASDIAYFGGQKTIDFWQENSRKVYLTDAVTLAQMILLYSPNYVAEYPFGIKEFTYSQKFYDENLTLRERLEFLEQEQVDLIIVRHKEELGFYQENPANFQLVFENHYLYQKPRDLYIFEYSNP